MNIGSENILERAQREYRQLEPAPELRTRVLSQVFDRAPRPTFRWTTGLAVGFAAGCAVMGGVLVWERASAPPASDTAMEAGIALAVEGEVETWRAVGGHQSSPRSRVTRNQRLDTRSWVETQRRASLKLAVGPHQTTVKEDSAVRLDCLQAHQLAFSVGRGSAHFDVAKLPAGATFAVRSGELLVEVVGTEFTVERNGRCSMVEVMEGRVRTTFREQTRLVAAGESGRYCETPGTASKTAPAPPPKSKNASVPLRNPTNTSPPGAAGAPAGTLTQEEQDYRQGLNAVRAGDSLAARGEFERYLQRYPTGSFSQDARFQLVRLSYAAREYGQTVRHGQQFLAQAGGGGARGSEVRLLVAQSLLQQERGANEAYELLAPLVQGSAVSGAQGEQVLYLAILAANRSGRTGEERALAERYLTQYPGGRYANEVRKSVNR